MTDHAAAAATAVTTTHPNPRELPIMIKMYYTYIPSIVGFLVCFVSTTTVPAEPELQATFVVSPRVSMLPFTLYILGLALGPIVAAPVSENFGRRPVYLLSIGIFSILLVGSALSQNLASLVVCRFISGVFGGSALVVGFGLLADIWDPSDLPVALSVFNTVPFCGPATGQLVSSYVISYRSWPWTQWTSVFLAAFTLLTILPMRETHVPTLIKRQRKIDEKACVVEQKPVKQRLKAALATIPFFRPLDMLVRELVVLMFALYITFNFAVVYCFSASIPWTFDKQYRFDRTSQGLVFLSLIIGYCLSAPFMIIPFMLQRKKHQASYNTGGDSPAGTRLAPERFLWPALFASVALPASFFWFGWSAKHKLPWICPVMALSLFAWGNNLLYNAAQLYLLETYGSQYGASATAANNLLRYIAAAILPLFMTQMYNSLGVNWAASIFGIILLLFLPILWALKRYGPWMRAHSRYLRHAESPVPPWNTALHNEDG